MMGSECGWGLGEGSNFEFLGIFKWKEKFDPNFYSRLCRLSCPFICTHGSEIAVRTGALYLNWLNQIESTIRDKAFRSDIAVQN